jgi:Rne/Rng family ribonuclease
MISSKELVISANRHETKVALLEDDQLVEVYFQRANEYSLAGSIHKGRVTRVLPGMQSAFVDLGLERDTFLYVSDFLEEHEDIDKFSGDERLPPERSGRDGREGRDGRDRDRDRDERRGRSQGDERRGERRPSSQPPPLPPIAESPAASTLAEADVAPESLDEGATPAVVSPSLSAPLVVPPQSPLHAPAGSPPEHRDDRRGRRSRRRRNRGRGFPDAKYAPETSAAPAAESEEPEVEERAAPAPAATEPPIVLPGESLAKYRHAPPSHGPARGLAGGPARGPATGRASEPEHERPEAVEELRRPVEVPAAIAPSTPVVVPPPIPQAVPEEKEENEYDQPIHYPPDNVLPDLPAHLAEPDTPERLAEIPFADAPPPLPTAHVEAEAEESDDGVPAVASMGDEDEDLDIQAMILGEAGGEDGGEDEEGEQAEQSEDPAGSEPVAAAGETPAAGLETGSAQIRQRAGQYPHRVSRRMRRGRGRGDRSERGPERGSERGTERGPEGLRSGEDREQIVSRPAIRPAAQTPSISDLLKEGQEIIVQIAKEPLGQKGARITSHVALPGRYVVYMPTLEHMGVSRKIGSDEERLRLKRILQGRRPGPVGGFITRTAAEGRTEEEIAADMQFLYSLWTEIRRKAESKPAPLLLHHDLDIVQRILRDQLADTFKAIWIDNEELYENVLSFVQRFQPSLVGKVKLYTRDAPIFDAFSITSELEKALRPKVWLKSGGYIVINQTEALVAVDVNTGKFVGKSNRLEDTIVKTNTEAIKEIVRQIRLRDLGGIIVIDFIDMDERKNRTKVMQVLEEAMRVDRAPYKILQFNDFGLVAITRKRVKQSLERTLCSPCPHCEGAGYIKSTQTVVSEILTEARKMSSSVEGKDVMLRVHPDVAKVLKSHQNKFLEELEDVLRRPVLVRSDPLLHHEKFDLA